MYCINQWVEIRTWRAKIKVSSAYSMPNWFLLCIYVAYWYKSTISVFHPSYCDKVSKCIPNAKDIFDSCMKDFYKLLSSKVKPASWWAITWKAPVIHMFCFFKCMCGIPLRLGWATHWWCSGWFRGALQYYSILYHMLY